MEFFNSAVTTLQTIVVALAASVWAYVKRKSFLFNDGLSIE